MILTLGIPRAQVLLAGGLAEPDATEFELHAAVGDEEFGILSNPFLAANFRTISYRIHITIHPDGTWSYEEEGVMEIPDRPEPFHHIDRNTLHRVAPPVLNPLAVEAGLEPPTVAPGGGLGLGSLREQELQRFREAT